MRLHIYTSGTLEPATIPKMTSLEEKQQRNREYQSEHYYRHRERYVELAKLRRDNQTEEDKQKIRDARKIYYEKNKEHLNKIRSEMRRKAKERAKEAETAIACN